MQLNYTVKGHGKRNLILLHGWGGSLNSLAKLQQLLAETGEFRVYNIEWPGFGASVDNYMENSKFTDFKKILSEFIKKNKIHKPTLIGHSFGGKVAIAIALENTRLIDRLILINSSGLKPKNNTKRIILYTPTKIFGAIFSLPGLNKLKKIIRKYYYIRIVRERDYIDNDHLRSTLRNVLKVNFGEELKNIKTDTFLIWGEKDKYTPLWMGKKLKNLIPNSRLEIIKDAKHNLPLVNPELVTTLIKLYIN